MTKESFDYQEAVKEIEAILAEIESGEPNINELSDLVHKAAALLATCKEKLRATEKEIGETLDGLDQAN